MMIGIKEFVLVEFDIFEDQCFVEELCKVKEELFNFCFQLVIGQLESYGCICVVKCDIVCFYMVICECELGICVMFVLVEVFVKKVIKLKVKKVDFVDDVVKEEVE